MSNRDQSTPRIEQGIFPILILFLVCAIATALLAFTNTTTEPIRKMRREEMLKTNRLALFPAAQDFKKLDLTAAKAELSDPDQLTDAFTALDAQGNVLGYLFETKSNGYGGPVPIMTAIDQEANISGIRILTNEETAGLGKKIELPAFSDQMVGLKAEPNLTTDRSADGKQPFDAVSGATISSNAVASAVNTACRAYQLVQGGAK